MQAKHFQFAVLLRFLSCSPVIPHSHLHCTHKVWHLEVGLHLGCSSHLFVFLDKDLWVPSKIRWG